MNIEQRELKFRYTAIRQNGHIFSSVFSIKQIELGEAALWFRVNHIGENTTVHREQYTGLRDKNGNEICEGDIVKWMDSFVQIFQVEWDYRRACFIHGGDWITKSYTQDCEIIGNIHENPELLKKDRE